MSTVLTILLTIVTLIFLVLLISTVYFYRLGIIRQKRKDILLESPDLEANRTSSSGDVPLPEIPWVEQQAFENIDMMSFDGLLLRGYYLPAKVPTSRTAILAHGYMGHARNDMALFARMYHEQFGYNVLMPDTRGHGASEGGYIGFGWHDRLDYIKWIHYAIQRAGEGASIVLHGISMGGSTVLMTSGEPLPQEVKCVISDCAYTSALDILTYQLKRMYKLPAFPLIPLTSLLCKLHAGYSFAEASAIKQVRKNRLPTLFIHGAEDTFVPTAMVHQLYEQCSALHREVVITPGAGHALAYTTDPAAYESATQTFLTRFIS
ncbi:alpha/beta hydrolase [Ktedonospora formicarum]|uniref:Alpha/beta hydrolase n=1 Tax=Ktedonospora formicarum TaxID=2778364 RepID=A0A8J3I8T1_9CHLR|nr:alpha/beta hydrolase [Ktedonospora formicarum]GHO48127.1 alpha/beta hydrolase [Ktedonospora formicarum]